MKDGLYKARFSTSQGNRMRDMGTGVVVVTGSAFQGGDTHFAYRGTLSSDGDNVRADLTVFPHTPGNRSVFGPDNVTATLTGRPHAGGVTLSGSAPQAPGVQFTVTLTLLE